jgi:hypothetical protein
VRRKTQCSKASHMRNARKFVESGIPTYIYIYIYRFMMNSSGDGSGDPRLHDSKLSLWDMQRILVFFNGSREGNIDSSWLQKSLFFTATSFITK